MVLFKIAGGEIVPEIEMLLSEKVLDLKQKIQTKLDVAVNRQSLLHDNIMLRNHELIGDFGFGATETLYLSVTPLSPQHELNVRVKFSTVETVRVKETDTVSYLRGKVEDIWPFPPALACLTRCDVVMRDDLLLSAYYVNEGSEVQVKYDIEPR